MNIALEIKKREVEIMKVQAAKAEQELRIHEALEQIERLKSAMVTQDEHVAKLTKEIGDLKARLG